MTERVKFVQAQLNAKGLDAGAEDGVLGPKTIEALEKVEGLAADWPDERKLIGFIQLLAGEKDIEAGPVDGLWGPQTEFAFESLQHVAEHDEPPASWRPEEIPDLNPSNWPKQTPEQELIDFYGEVDTNQTNVDLPYPHKLSWQLETVVNRFRCHEKVSDSIGRVLTRVFEHYGQDEISQLRLDVWGGCLNVRKMRGGDRYSMHSWGIAIDYDPESNKLKWGRDRATFAKPDYDMWWRFWEEEGWVSLGRLRNFDWMHVQAAKI